MQLIVKGVKVLDGNSNGSVFVVVGSRRDYE